MWSPASRQKRLQTLYREFADCTKCQLHEHRREIVFGNGPSDASLFFIGGHPGEDEDETGAAFCGPSGYLLNSLLEAAGISREEVFVTNTVMCTTPEGRNPARCEQKECFDRLSQQIYAVDPLLVIPVGGVALEMLIPGAKKITTQQGKILSLKVPGHAEKEVVYDAMPILDPTYIMREDTVNKKTMQWDQGGPAHQTVKHLVSARKRVEWIKSHYDKKPETKAPPPRQKRLRVAQ